MYSFASDLFRFTPPPRVLHTPQYVSCRPVASGTALRLNNTAYYCLEDIATHTIVIYKYIYSTWGFFLRGPGRDYYSTLLTSTAALVPSKILGMYTAASCSAAYLRGSLYISMRPL